MEPAECREKMSKLIAEESAGLNQLMGLLEHEYGLLAAGDTVALTAAINDRQRCVGSIARMDEERRALCQALNFPLDVGGLESVMRWCDPAGILSGGWAECAVAANHCRMLNDRNAALVGAQLNHVRARLAALMQAGRETLTYRANGAYSQGSTGRMLATEA